MLLFSFNLFFIFMNTFGFHMLILSYSFTKFSIFRAVLPYSLGFSKYTWLHHLQTERVFTPPFLFQCLYLLSLIWFYWGEPPVHVSYNVLFLNVLLVFVCYYFCLFANILSKTSLSAFLDEIYGACF